MTRRQRAMTVEARADLILADESSATAYAAHFEAQLHDGRVRRLLYASCLWLARASKGTWWILGPLPPAPGPAT